MLTRRKLGALLGAMLLMPGRAHGGPPPQRHRVQIQKSRFAPQRLAIRPGDTVEWVNLDIAPHTATATDGEWDTGDLNRDEAREVRFEVPGRKPYLCAFHPNMTGEVVVRDS